MVLHKIGVQARCAEWIMACAKNVSYVVVINGYPTDFLRVGWGHRQVFSLSPLLFILAMDGLILHIRKFVTKGHFDALVFDRDIRISHGFFVDDVLIMGMINGFAWLTLFHIFAKFWNVIELYMNLQKPIILHGTCDPRVIANIHRLFGVAADTLTRGMKYFGYHISPVVIRLMIGCGLWTVFIKGSLGGNSNVFLWVVVSH